jgi:hypothetical protein
MGSYHFPICVLAQRGRSRGIRKESAPPIGEKVESDLLSFPHRKESNKESMPLLYAAQKKKTVKREMP